MGNMKVSSAYCDFIWKRDGFAKEFFGVQLERLVLNDAAVKICCCFLLLFLYDCSS